MVSKSKADTPNHFERSVNTVKKNIGPALALYPTPAVVIGAMNGEKPTWTLAAYVLVSLAGAHFINEFIKSGKKLSVNIVDEGMLPEADYVGSVSGAKVDKSAVFEYEPGEAGAPIIQKAPLTMECSVVDAYSTQGFESFICTIDNIYVEEEHLNEAGKIDYHTLKPVLFAFPTYEYLKTGEVIGKCLSFKKDPQA